MMMAATTVDQSGILPAVARFNNLIEDLMEKGSHGCQEKERAREKETDSIAGPSPRVDQKETEMGDQKVLASSAASPSRKARKAMVVDHGIVSRMNQANPGFLSGLSRHAAKHRDYFDLNVHDKANREV